jgi:hypothetical protein
MENKSNRNNEGRLIVLSLQGREPFYDGYYNCDVSSEFFSLEVFEGDKLIAESRQHWRYTSFGGFEEDYTSNDAVRMVAENLGREFDYVKVLDKTPHVKNKVLEHCQEFHS